MGLVIAKFHVAHPLRALGDRNSRNVENSGATAGCSMSSKYSGCKGMPRGKKRLSNYNAS